MNFIKDLIADKANFLAYYFMINGINKYEQLNSEELSKKFNLIDKSFNDIIISLKKHYLSINFKQCIELIRKLNTINNINSSNYGTEGHIINFLKLYDNSYIKVLKEYLDIIKKDEINDKSVKIYTFDDYMKKIGCDIGIFYFFYIHNKSHKNEINFNIRDMFFDDFIKGFNINKDEFIDKYNKEIKKYQYNITTYTRTNILLQQIYNIVNYPLKQIKIHNEDVININFINTRLLQCEIPLELIINQEVNDTKFADYLLRKLKFDVM